MTVSHPFVLGCTSFLVPRGSAAPNRNYELLCRTRSRPPPSGAWLNIGPFLLVYRASGASDWISGRLKDVLVKTDTVRSEAADGSGGNGRARSVAASRLISGRRFRAFVVLDERRGEHGGESLAIEVHVSLTGERVTRVLERLRTVRGQPTGFRPPACAPRASRSPTA